MTVSTHSVAPSEEDSMGLKNKKHTLPWTRSTCLGAGGSMRRTRSIDGMVDLIFPHSRPLALHLARFWCAGNWGGLSKCILNFQVCCRQLFTLFTQFYYTTLHMHIFGAACWNKTPELGCSLFVRSQHWQPQNDFWKGSWLWINHLSPASITFFSCYFISNVVVFRFF